MPQQAVLHRRHPPFKAAAADIAQMVNSLIVAMRDQFGMDRRTISNMKPYVILHWRREEREN